MTKSVQQIRNQDEYDNESVRFFVMISNILKNRWLIASVACSVVLFGSIYAMSAQPIYEANLVMQIKRGASLAGDAPIEIPTATEMELLRSRSIISHAVSYLQLDLNVRPKLFPFLGAAISHNNKQISEPGLFGHGGYVWGAEQVDVSSLTLPDKLLGRIFQLTVTDKEQFNLLQKEIGISMHGKIGEMARTHTAFGDVEILISSIRAKPGAQFLVSRSPPFETIDRLQKSLILSEKGKQSNMIELSLKGTNPDMISRTLNEIGNEYIRQHTAEKTEETEKALSISNQQLNESKQKLQRSDTQIAQVRRTRGVFDVNEEARSLLQQSVAIQEKLADAKQKREELLSRYLDKHPLVILASKHIQDLNNDLSNIAAKSKALAAAEHEILSATRDKQAITEINSDALNMRRRLDTLAPRNNLTVRMVDRAEIPVLPVTLPLATKIAVCCLAGILLGLLASFLKNISSRKIDGPREIERELGITVSASIPHCESRMKKLSTGRKDEKDILALPQHTQVDGAIESLRVFRSTVQYLMRESERKIIMFTGPTPGVGKSFVSANFAIVLAGSAKNVLLIDCDMRAGNLHRYFGLPRANGLSEFLASGEGGESLINRRVAANLDFISAGNFPMQTSELLSTAAFDKLLRMLSTRYDYIVVDTAPVLNSSDALVVGVHASAIFVVVRNEVSDMTDTEEAVRRLNRAGLTVTGIIVNDVKSLKLPAIGHEYGARNILTHSDHGYQSSEEGIDEFISHKA